MPSLVAQHALDRGFPSELIFTPERAGEVNVVSGTIIFYMLPLKFEFCEYNTGNGIVMLIHKLNLTDAVECLSCVFTSIHLPSL